MKQIALSLAMLVFCFAHAQVHADTPAEKMFALEDLQKAANYLGQRIERPKAELLKCDPEEETAKAWLSGPLHALMDAKIAAEGGRFERNPSQLLKRAKNCHRECTCNAFAAVLETTELAMSKHPAYKELTKLLDKETKRQDAVACAKAYTSFCAGKLEAYLKGEK